MADHPYKCRSSRPQRAATVPRNAPSGNARLSAADGILEAPLEDFRRSPTGCPKCATQSVISRMEEGGGARNRIDTLVRVATALNRHLVVSFPDKLPAKLKDAVQVA
jgi:hypothetical protein